MFFGFRDPAGFDPELVWEASSYLKKYDDKYNLVISVRDEKAGTSNESSVTNSVAKFIDSNGIIIPELVEAMVSNLHDSLTASRKDK